MQRSGNPFIRVSILDLMDSAIEMKEGICWKISVWQMSWLSVILLFNNIRDDCIHGQVRETE